MKNSLWNGGCEGRKAEAEGGRRKVELVEVFKREIK